MPVLSIVIPVRNMAQWLSTAIESCLWQTHNDVEIIIVDDGSSDNSEAIASAYEGIDSRIRLVSQKNTGPGGARMRGQEEAAGDFITWLDADDFLAPGAAAAWLNCAAKNNDELVCGNAVAFSNLSFNARRYFPHPPATGLSFDTAPDYWKSKVLWRWAFSLPFIRACSVRHNSYKLGQDVCVMFQILTQAEKFAQAKDTVYYFRQEHKTPDVSLETKVEHALAHFLDVKEILLAPSDNRPRIKPFIKYLNENYWRDIKNTVPLLTHTDPEWEKSVMRLGFCLFDGLEPRWFRQPFLSPELKENREFLPLADAMLRKDADAVRSCFSQLQSCKRNSHDKKTAFHLFRQIIKARFEPLSWSVRRHLRRLEEAAASRKGVPPPEGATRLRAYWKGFRYGRKKWESI